MCLTIKESQLTAIADDPDTEEIEDFASAFMLTIDQETDGLPTTLWNSMDGDYRMHGADRVWEQEISFDPTLDIRINLQTTETCGRGHKVFRLHMVVSDEGCDGVIVEDTEGFPLPVGAEFETWEFESGLTIPEHRELYCAIGQSMQELSGMVPWADEGGIAECAE